MTNFISIYRCLTLQYTTDVQVNLTVFQTPFYSSCFWWLIYAIKHYCFTKWKGSLSTKFAYNILCFVYVFKCVLYIKHKKYVSIVIHYCKSVHLNCFFFLRRKPLVIILNGFECVVCHYQTKFVHVCKLSNGNPLCVVPGLYTCCTKRRGERRATRAGAARAKYPAKTGQPRITNIRRGHAFIRKSRETALLT